jgi:predicted nucleic acid-binding protein
VGRIVSDLLLIDTDILIDAGRNIADAVTRLQSEAASHTLAVSTVTAMELLVGCRDKREQREIERFLRHFVIVPLDPKVSGTAVELVKKYRLSHGLLIADALIAATAIEANIPLLSKNQRDYRFIKELALEKY